MKVYKYRFPNFGDLSLIDLPEGFEVLSFDFQDGKPHIWCAVDESKPVKRYRAALLFTGNTLPRYINPRDHIGTRQKGGLVYHAFLSRKAVKAEPPDGLHPF